ncbi:MAG: hypothetical protein B6230_02445, partial [Desulfobacteraceae bacterium 4572_89]
MSLGKYILSLKNSKGFAGDIVCHRPIALIHAAVHRQLRTIVYTQSRKITELIAIWASQRASAF